MKRFKAHRYEDCVVVYQNYRTRLMQAIYYFGMRYADESKFLPDRIIDWDGNVTLVEWV